MLCDHLEGWDREGGRETQGGKPWGGGDGGVLNWAIGIDMYTLMCIHVNPNRPIQHKIGRAHV